MAASDTRTLLRDAVLLAFGGTAFAVLANWVSPRGLSLTRDYFPAAPAVKAPTPPPSTSAPQPPAETASKAAAVSTPARSKRGLPLASQDEVVALFRDPRNAEGRVIFIDARDDEHYAAAHIPGAYQFDHYHPDRYMATVLGAAAIAEKIVVYCNGGECEDSELATLDLIALGIPDSKLVIYGGGIGAWTEHKLPIERGARGSGATNPP